MTRRSALTLAAGAGLFGLSRRTQAAPAALRVATLDYALAETMLLIGAVPVAVMSSADWATWVVEPPLPASVVDLGASQEPSLERLAALRPDLVLTTDYVAMAEPAISRIAPVERVTIYRQGPEPLPRSREVTELLGDRLDRRAEAAAAIRAFDVGLDRLRMQVPHDTPPLLLVTFMDDRHIRIYGNASLYGNVLPRLGLRNAFEDEVNVWGFATVGLEALATMSDAHLVTFEPVPADLWQTTGRSPLWTQLPFVKAGRVTVLPPVLMFGALASAGRFARLVTASLSGRAA